jgi:hypothetical protein
MKLRGLKARGFLYPLRAGINPDHASIRGLKAAVLSRRDKIGKVSAGLTPLRITHDYSDVKPAYVTGFPDVSRVFH